MTATADLGAGDRFASPAPAGLGTFVDASTETFAIDLCRVTGLHRSAVGRNPDRADGDGADPAGDPLASSSAPTVALASDPGITYTVSAAGPYSGGQSITVTATADATHDFSSPGADGWTFVDANHETFGITFHANPTCSGALASTGVNSRQLIDLGGIVLLFGLGLQFISMGMRRRPTA